MIANLAISAEQGHTDKSAFRAWFIAWLSVFYVYSLQA